MSDKEFTNLINEFEYIGHTIKIMGAEMDLLIRMDEDE